MIIIMKKSRQVAGTPASPGGTAKMGQKDASRTGQQEGQTHGVGMRLGLPGHPNTACGNPCPTAKTRQAQPPSATTAQPTTARQPAADSRGPLTTSSGNSDRAREIWRKLSASR